MAQNGKKCPYYRRTPMRAYLEDAEIRGGNENARSADEMGVCCTVSRICPLERNSRVIGGREGL